MEIKRTDNFKAVSGDHSNPPKPVFKNAVQPQALGDAFIKSPKQSRPIDLKKAAGELFNQVQADPAQLLWKTPVSMPNIPELKLTADGTTLVKGGSGWIHALAPDGTVKWEEKLGSEINSIDLLPDNTILVCGYKEESFSKYTGLFAALSPEGKIKRQVKTDTTNLTYSPDGTVLAGGEKGILSAYDTEGKLKWQVKTGKEEIISEPKFSADGTILLKSEDKHRLLGISPQGKIKWQVKPGGEIDSFKVAGDGSILLVSNRNMLSKVSPQGKLKWRKKIEENDSLTCLTPAGTSLLRNTLGDLQAFDPEGNLKWKFEKLPGGLYYNSPLQAPDGTILVKGHNESKTCLFALEPSEGKVKWQAESRCDSCRSLPLVVSEQGTILWPTQYGNITVLNPEGVKIRQISLDAKIETSPVEKKDGTILLIASKPGTGPNGCLGVNLYAFGERAAKEKEAEKAEVKANPEILNTQEYIIIDGVKLAKRKR